MRTAVAERDVDLVLRSGDSGAGTARLSVENKTIMAAHGKARKNRYGDLIAYSNHVHNHNRNAVAGAILVINTSPSYLNPDAFAKDLIRPRYDMEKVVRTTVEIFATIPQRDNPTESNELPEAVAVILVEYDGVTASRLINDSPAPDLGAQIHYATFLKRMCDLYTKRFGA